MVTSTEWARQNPERWREHQRRYRLKKRKPCKKCGQALLLPGVQYHSDCLPNRSQIFRKRRLKELQDYKLKRGCDKCGYNRSARSLDFHHRDPSLKKHRVWVPRGVEFGKCDLLCKNCHYELHDENTIENGDCY